MPYQRRVTDGFIITAAIIGCNFGSFKELLNQQGNYCCRPQPREGVQRACAAVSPGAKGGGLEEQRGRWMLSRFSPAPPKAQERMLTARAAEASGNDITRLRLVPRGWWSHAGLCNLALAPAQPALLACGEHPYYENLLLSREGDRASCHLDSLPFSTPRGAARAESSSWCPLLPETHGVCQAPAGGGSFMGREWTLQGHFAAPLIDGVSGVLPSTALPSIPGLHPMSPALSLARRSQSLTPHLPPVSCESR